MQNSNTVQIEVGTKVFSADTSSHGCREGWVAEVTAVDGDAVTATITSNTHCYSCWQTGCDDHDRDDNDMVGRVVTFDASWAFVDEAGDVVARNATIS